MPKRKQAAKLCYVIMPFSKTKTCTEDEWTDIFESIIKPAVEAASLAYSCLRSEATTGNIIKKVVNSLYQANVVIADLTDRNPNVFYELGVRHTLKNRTIMIAQRRKDIPSDLDGYASHVYKWKTTPQKEALAEKLKELLHHIEQDIDRSDNPVSDFLHERSIRILQFQREENARKLRALVEELDMVTYVLGRLLSEDEKTTAEADEPIFVHRFAVPALDHFIATQYIHNRQFTRQGIGFRNMLETVGGEAPDRVTLEKVLKGFKLLKRNAERLMAAYEAGDATDTLRLDKAD